MWIRAGTTVQAAVKEILTNQNWEFNSNAGQMLGAALCVLEVRLKWRSSWLKRRNAWSSTIGAKNVLWTVPKTQTQTHPNHRKLQSLLIRCVFIKKQHDKHKRPQLPDYFKSIRCSFRFASRSTTMTWDLWNDIWSHASQIVVVSWLSPGFLNCLRGEKASSQIKAVKTLHFRSWE